MISQLRLVGSHNTNLGAVPHDMRSGSFGLLEDKKRCRMVSDEMCVMCDSRVGKDVDHFLVGCGEFKIDRQVLLDGVCIIVEGR